jgi:hypothetical protein
MYIVGTLVAGHLRKQSAKVHEISISTTTCTLIQAIGKHFVPAALEFKQKVVLQIALEFKQSEKMVEWRTVETLLQQPGRQSFIDAYQMITAIDKQKHSPSGLSNIQ